MKLQSLLTSFVLAGALAAVPVGAAPIVDQPLDPTLSGALSNLGPANQQVADDFVISGLTTVGSATWYGRYGDLTAAPNPTDFTVRIFSDSGGAPPQTAAFEFSVSVIPVLTGLDLGGVPWYSYTADISAILGTGTYWFSVMENDGGTALSGNTQWLWGENNVSAQRSVRFSDAEAWVNGAGNNMAFSLDTTSSVPEPSTWLLLGTGLALGAFRKRGSAKG